MSKGALINVSKTFSSAHIMVWLMGRPRVRRIYTYLKIKCLTVVHLCVGVVLLLGARSSG
jgi:hypothetical protein